MNTKAFVLLLLMLTFVCARVFAQAPYPYAVKYLTLDIEGQQAKMAYMDVTAPSPNGKTAILFHGKNFNGYYWKDVIGFLNSKGYRVIVPDQLGWGRSNKPNIHYSFHQLASNNKVLLDSLHVTQVIVIGHSMGGMLATRFTLMYPAVVEKLVLEDPIGLEDYRTFVPYTSPEIQYQTEVKQTYDSYKKYMQSYFPVWKPEYEELVRQQAAPLRDTNFNRIAFVNSLTYEMIYEQPVCYEFKAIKKPTLIIVGLEDHTVVGKDKLSPNLKDKYGKYSVLGQKIHSEIKNSKLVELKGVGHIPHIQEFSQFKAALAGFLDK